MAKPDIATHFRCETATRFAVIARNCVLTSLGKLSARLRVSELRDDALSAEYFRVDIVLTGRAIQGIIAPVIDVMLTFK